MAYGQQVNGSVQTLQNPGERMAVEQVAELQVLAEHIEGFVAAEALELGGVDAAIHAGGQRAALEAVAGEVAPGKTGRDGVRALVA